MNAIQKLFVTSVLILLTLIAAYPKTLFPTLGYVLLGVVVVSLFVFLKKRRHTFAESVRKDCLILMRDAGDMFREVSQQLSEGKQSLAAQRHLKTASEEYDEARQKIAGIMNASDWVVLYTLLNSVLWNLKKAKGEHVLRNAPWKKYPPEANEIPAALPAADSGGNGCTGSSF